MSDGQLQQTHEEWVKTHDELQQLRAKLENIRKKGGWMEGVPTEEDGWYRIEIHSDYKASWRLVQILTIDSNRWVIERGYHQRLADWVERHCAPSVRHARLLTPEDLE